jgi:hypothetical protein
MSDNETSNDMANGSGIAYKITNASINTGATGAGIIDWNDIGKDKTDQGTFFVDGTKYWLEFRKAYNQEMAGRAAAAAADAGIVSDSLFHYSGKDDNGNAEEGTYLYHNGVAYGITNGGDNNKVLTKFKYKTGGLADFTGPAWLDGTPSKPEYILNAEQTGRFFELIDVLGSFDKIGKKNETDRGDNYYDIDINVENISDDYDVEQLAEKIKEIIYDDSTYRNVNMINQIR